MIKKSETLTLTGLLALTLGIGLPYFDLGNEHIFVFAIIFFTGSIITSAIEDKKCHT